MRTVGTVLCLFLVLAAAYAAAGDTHAVYAGPNDGPLVLETHASESPLDPVVTAASPALGDEENNGTDVPPGHSDDGPPGHDGDAPPGQDDAPPGQDDTPPGQDDAPPGQDDDPGNSGEAGSSDDQDGDGESDGTDDGTTDESGDAPDGDGDDQADETGPDDVAAGEQDGESDGEGGESGSGPDDGESERESAEGESESESEAGESAPEGGEGEAEESDDEQQGGDVDAQPPTASVDSTATQPQFDTSLASVENVAIAVGEHVQVPMEVENDGEREGTFETTFRVDGEPVASASVTVGAGETETVVFEHWFDEPGEYELAAGETVLGTLTVTVPDDSRLTTNTDDVDGVDPTAAVDVVEATASSDWVREGHETTVRATVLNTANRTVTRALTVTVDGQPVANESVTLRSGQRDVVQIDFQAVDGNVAVEGVDAGDISVSERLGTGDASPTGDSDERGLGFAVAVLVALAGALAAVVALDVHEPP